jgi:hypothetical protein
MASTINLISQEGTEFAITIEAANLSVMLRDLLAHIDAVDERVSIPLPLQQCQVRNER